MYLIIWEALSDIHSCLAIRVSSSFCWNDRILTLFQATRSVHIRLIWIKCTGCQDVWEVSVFEISKRKEVRAALSNQDAFENCRITVALVLTSICDDISWRWLTFFTGRVTCDKFRHPNKQDRMVRRIQSQTCVLEHLVWIAWRWHNKVHYPLSTYMRHWTNRKFCLLHLNDVSMFLLK